LDWQPLAPYRKCRGALGFCPKINQAAQAFRADRICE
jgi:hypothetical protein